MPSFPLCSLPSELKVAVKKRPQTVGKTFISPGRFLPEIMHVTKMVLQSFFLFFIHVTSKSENRVIYTFFFKNINPKCCCSILKFRNQPILRFDVILQHDWPIEHCLLHIRVFFGGKTKRPCFDLFIHWLIKHITNTYRDHFSRPYQNRCMWINQNLATINKFLNF